MKEKLRNPFVQQYLMEIVLPLAGYFFFDWDVLIIGVYYFLDYLSGQVLFYRRAYWVMTKNAARGKFYLIFISITLFLAFFITEFIVFSDTVMVYNHWEFGVFYNQILAFAKEELWLLFPVLLFVTHFQDQFTFYAPRRYLKRDCTKFVLSDMFKGGIVFVLFMMGIFLWDKFMPHELVVIFGFIIGKVIFDLTLKNKIDKIAFV